MKKILFAICTIFSTYSHALVLEDMKVNGTLGPVLENSKLGFFIGSFNPMHVGLSEVVQGALDNNYCDYVLLFPLWEKVQKGQKPQMPDIAVRQNMLFALYENDPKVIVTRMTPQEIQTLLTKESPSQVDGTKGPREPAFSGLEILGLLGSDTALDLYTNQWSSSVFMTGQEITNEQFSSVGATLMAIPAQSFVVALRNGVSEEAFEKGLLGKSVVGTFTTQHADLASVNVRNAYQKKETVVDEWLAESVKKIIDENKLYQ